MYVRQANHNKVMFYKKKQQNKPHPPSSGLPPLTNDLQSIQIPYKQIECVRVLFVFVVFWASPIRARLWEQF